MGWLHLTKSISLCFCIVAYRFFVRHQSCQGSIYFSNYVSMHLVGVPGERAEGAAPKCWEEGGNGDQQNTHVKCHQVWKLNNFFLLMQPQGTQVCAASIGDKAVVCPGTYTEWGFLSPCHCWCWQLCTAGASWVATPSLSCHLFNHSIN